MSDPTDTSTRDLMDKDKGLTRPPTARELVGSQIGRCRDGRGPDDSGQCGCPGGLLAARVEAVLDEMPARPEPPADLYAQGWWDALAHVERLLNKPA